MSQRYSHLAPLAVDEQAAICMKLCDFFHIMNIMQRRSDLNLPIGEALIPLTLLDFFNYHKKKGCNLFHKMYRINELVTKLRLSNILVSYGGINLNESFIFMKELSVNQLRGRLWLGNALGCTFIANEIAKDIVYITGETEQEDIAVGTGLLISSTEVLTCADVITDMKMHNKIEICGNYKWVDKCVPHPKIDVGIIYLKEQTQRRLNDLAFRHAVTLEEVVIAGFPSVPCSTDKSLTFQRGEISGQIRETFEGHPIDLFSAIARPGNSGGPVVGLDGQVVGIVTRSLERNREQADAMAPIPFFAAIPSSVIKSCVSELSEGRTVIPWEDYS